MHTVTSKDGTRIAFSKSGVGPPLVLVHGTTADHSRWKPLIPRLEAEFTVYAMDRRGRGESGDGPSYAMEREYEDVAAVIDSIGQPVSLLGHSFGAICSLNAASLTPAIQKLILYEPPIPVTGSSIYPPRFIDNLQAMVDQGRSEEIVTTFFREIVKMPAKELELLRSLPNWPARVAAAKTIPRELRTEDTFVFRPERFKELRVPTLLLLGGDSPAFFRKAVEAVHATLPNSRLVVLQGQQHAAMNTAPELFLREVLGFLRER